MTWNEWNNNILYKREIIYFPQDIHSPNNESASSSEDNKKIRNFIKYLPFCDNWFSLGQSDRQAGNDFACWLIHQTSWDYLHMREWEIFQKF